MVSIDEHRQVWAKVNAQVDEGIAEVVCLLNSIPDLQTLDSCQGTPLGVKPAHVYFYYGDWKNICHFMFEILGPQLAEAVTGNHIASVEVFNGSNPMGKLSFDTEATNVVTSVLRRVANYRP
jgi:hypothetical protein